MLSVIVNELVFVSVLIPAVMDNSTEEMQEGGGANTEINKKEAELKEEKTHNNLKGTQHTFAV